MTHDEISVKIRDLCSDYLLAIEAETYASMSELLCDFIADLEQLEREADKLLPNELSEEYREENHASN